jgi:hypothetical protein
MYFNRFNVCHMPNRSNSPWFHLVNAKLPITVAARSKRGFAAAGIVGSNPAGSMDVCLLWVLCVVRQRSLRRAGPSSRGVLPSVVCLKCVIAKPRKMRRPRPPKGCWAIERKKERNAKLPQDNRYSVYDSKYWVDYYWFSSMFGSAD